ncbi:amidohydrolase family protein [Leifsonia poae]|uniref:Metal-dependent hydrolase n=1 Tax=Leifsonia poae TaxID=110933 RepID=A0A9W6HAW9_9MICO|nr:amidohydrolase family protein [Leifsonia poae]GLJ77150.1 metal-dependent hydrolase [Leifsonia poae]
MTVDAHLHLWDLERVEYPWLTEAAGPIFRTFAFTEIEPQLHAEGVDRVVLVQAANSLADSASMFDVAAASPLVAGVVAWVDLLDPAAAARQLDGWAAHPEFVGVRHLIHDEPDADWLARASVQESLGLVAARGATFDVIGVLPRHLEHALALAEAQPALRLVIDHVGTPPVGTDDHGRWASLLSRLAGHPQVFAKLSGLTTLGPAGHATASELRPFAEHVLDAFGPDRVLFGGDWPVSTLAGDYAQTTAVARELASGLSDAEQSAVFGGTAARVYRL